MEDCSPSVSNTVWNWTAFRCSKEGNNGHSFLLLRKGVGREREISFWRGFDGALRDDESSHQQGSVLQQAIYSCVTWCFKQSFKVNIILSIWETGPQIIQTVRADSTWHITSSHAYFLNAVSQRNVPSRFGSFSSSGHLGSNKWALDKLAWGQVQI